MRIGHFSLLQVKKQNVTLAFDGKAICDIRFEKESGAFYYDLGDYLSPALETARSLISTFPYGFDKNYLYDDVGVFGIDLESAYAGEYGHISYLLQELIRLYFYREQFSVDPSKALIVVYNKDTREFSSLIKGNTEIEGEITFQAEKWEDFELL